MKKDEKKIEGEIPSVHDNDSCVAFHLKLLLKRDCK